MLDETLEAVTVKQNKTQTTKTKTTNPPDIGRMARAAILEALTDLFERASRKIKGEVFELLIRDTSRAPRG